VTAWAASTARRTVGFGEKAKARTLQKDIGMSWTDERVELLKKLWSDGLSASQIAAELGGITRNAVIGKVHRLGLSGRAKSASSAAPRPRKARSPMMRIGRASIRGNTALAHAYEMEAEAAPELIDNVIPIGQRRTILELTEQTCRWPVGDPGSTEFFFCGGNTLGGLPYCALNPRNRDAKAPEPWAPSGPGHGGTCGRLDQAVEDPAVFNPQSTIIYPVSHRACAIIGNR
jgi:GcrA cell cycle regulator